MAVATFLLAALALVAAGGDAVEAVPDRPAYVERVEPICKQNAEANERILEGVQGKMKRGELAAAGRQFIRAADALREAIAEIVAVPRPPADDRRLKRWIEHLEHVRDNLRRAGAALKTENEIRANHDLIRAERSGNAANNAGFPFGFHYCHLKASRFD